MKPLSPHERGYVAGLSAGMAGIILIITGVAYAVPVLLVVGALGVIAMLAAPEVIARGSYEYAWLNLRLRTMVRQRLRSSQATELVLAGEQCVVALWEQPTYYYVIAIPLEELQMNGMGPGLGLAQCDLYVIMRQWSALGSTTLYRPTYTLMPRTEPDGRFVLHCEELVSENRQPSPDTALHIGKRRERLSRLLREIKLGQPEET